MAAIEAMVLVVAAGFALMFAAFVLIIIGIHQEERRGTLAYGGPPTLLARLARHVVGGRFALLAGAPEAETYVEDLVS
jgi:hypothetical protein